METAPYIPDSAPFSAEQRAWLNGFLAGLFPRAAGAAPAAQPVERTMSFGVFFASQTGTAERLAKKMVKALKAQGHVAELASLATVGPGDLARHDNALIFASTYGEGEPPESARSFADQLFASSAPAMKGLRYSVFCLGDAQYEHFCKFGVDVDERLAVLGGTRLAVRSESDVEVEEPFETWKRAVQQRCARESGGLETLVSAEVSEVSRGDALVASRREPERAQIYTRDNPFYAAVTERRALTSSLSSKLTVHLSLALDETGVHYSAGDACGVLAQNDPVLVEEILRHLPFGEEAVCEVAKAGATTIREALLHHLQPTRLTRAVVQHFAELSGSEVLSALLTAGRAAKLEAFMYDRGLVDLLEEYPGVISAPEQLAAVLPRLAPRLYSISSSPAAHGREVHCTIGVVRYRSHNRERGGVASTMLAERVVPGQRVPIYIHPNKKFRLPEDSSAPVIMIGPGTGIAPFRAFLHERQALGHRGRNWLFFGERSASSDFLYCRELKGMYDSGHLARLDTAFSRDQAEKVYVQQRMVEHGAELWRWLNEGARVYVCGDASRMAKDVDAALHRVVAQHGGMNAELAQEYVADLQDCGRYLRDVY